MDLVQKIMVMLQVADPAGYEWQWSGEQFAVIGKRGNVGEAVVRALGKMGCIVYWFPADAEEGLLRWRLPQVNKIIVLEGADGLVDEEKVTTKTVVIDASVYFDMDMRRHDAVSGFLYSKGCIVKYVH